MVAEKLALEVRDADVLLAYFYTFSLQKHTLAPLELPQSLTWWQGLEDAHEGMVYLHGYADRQLGQHKGITALEAASGKITWELPELAFYGVTTQGILAFPAAQQETNYTLLATTSGKILKSNISQQEAAIATDQYSLTRYSSITYPMLYLEEEEYFADLNAFLQQLLHVEPVKALEYAETEKCFVVSYYLQQGTDKLNNFVAVFNLDGHELLKVQIGANLSGIGSDTFFIFKDELYLIRNKNLFQVYSLKY